VGIVLLRKVVVGGGIWAESVLVVVVGVVEGLCICLEVQGGEKGFVDKVLIGERGGGHGLVRRRTYDRGVINQRSVPPDTHKSKSMKTTAPANIIPRTDHM